MSGYDDRDDVHNALSEQNAAAFANPFDVSELYEKAIAGYVKTASDEEIDAFANSFERDRAVMVREALRGLKYGSDAPAIAHTAISQIVELMPKSPDKLVKMLDVSTNILNTKTAKFMGKKVPMLSVLFGCACAEARWHKGEKFKAGLEAVSGVAGAFPGWGTLIGTTIDIRLLCSDYGIPCPDVIDPLMFGTVISASSKFMWQAASDEQRKHIVSEALRAISGTQLSERELNGWVKLVDDLQDPVGFPDRLAAREREAREKPDADGARRLAMAAAGAFKKNTGR